MIAAAEIYGLIFGLGLPLTVLLWPYIPVVVIKGVAAITIAAITGHLAMLATSFTWGFVTQLRKQRKGK